MNFKLDENLAKRLAGGALVLFSVGGVLWGAALTARNLLGNKPVTVYPTDENAAIDARRFNARVNLQMEAFKFDHRDDAENVGMVQIAFQREVADAFEDLEALRQTEGTACHGKGHRHPCATDAIANSLKPRMDKVVDTRSCDLAQEGEACRFEVVSFDRNGNPVDSLPVSQNVVMAGLTLRTTAVQIAAEGDGYTVVPWSYGNFLGAISAMQEVQQAAIQSANTVAVGEVD